VTKLQRDPEIKQVEVEPADYQDTKADLKAANEKIADLQKLVDDAVDDHNQRLAYELELEKAKADQEEIKADLSDLEVKRQNMLKQNAQIREVQKMVKSINELLDNFAVLRNRLDTTMLPDESSLVQGLTEMADKLIENGQVLHDDLAHPYHV
jgi:predicted  nucleic acid-binding Zn-ribbon protein